MASLIQRPGSNIWYVQYKNGGRWKRLSTKTESKKIAQEVLARFKVEEAREFNDLPTQRARHTLGELLQKYLEHSDSTQSPRWAKNKRLLFENFILPFFGADTPIKEITVSRIEAYQRERLKSVKPRTVNIETHHCLLPMLRKGAVWKMLPVSSIPVISKLQEQGGRLRFLSKEEAFVLRETASQLSKELEIFVMLGLFGGMRAGEIIALRWADVDLNLRTITVAPRQDWTPKTRRARVIPINDELDSFLSQRRAEGQPDGLILSVSYEGMKKRFHRLVRLAGLPITGDQKVTAHTLRHTFASHLVMAGTPLYTVAALLGHSNTETTRLYSHLAPSHLQQAVNGLNYEREKRHENSTDNRQDD
ncbi:MAG: tyrosine-type recombinase/integrase [Candidatus Omnitrophota bacterium]